MDNNEKILILNDLIIEKLHIAHIQIENHYFESGQQILKQGDVSNRLHILLSGQVQVYIEQERKVQLAILTEGQFFGEMSCLTGDSISAHVEALTTVHTISLNREGMMLLMDEHAQFRMQMIEAMVKRIRSSNERVLEEHKKSMLIMRHHESNEQNRYGELIGQSEEMLQLQRDIQNIASQSKHIVIYGEPGTEKLSVARKIHEHSIQAHYPFIVVSAKNLDWQSWLVKSLAAQNGTIIIENAEKLQEDMRRQILTTDVQTRVILTANKEIRHHNMLAISIPALRERVEDIPLLVKYFIQKAGISNAETAISEEALRFLKLFPYLSGNVEELQTVIQNALVLSEGRTIYHNHIRFGKNRQPGERPKIGLALGSGAARGIAHLGVLEVLEAEGIPIDMIAGTSAGAIFGGVYAAGMPLKELRAITSTLSWGQLVKPTFPIKSFVHNTPMIHFIEQHIGKKMIEELPTPFAAVASEMATGEAHIMRHGSLAHAICASTAIPSIMRPVRYQGKTLVDGAVVHPVPAALVKSMGADIVIAVNVCPESFAKGTARHFIDALLNTIDLMSAKLIKEELQIADIILRPELGYKPITFKDFSLCINAGQKVTKDALSQIKQQLT